MSMSRSDYIAIAQSIFAVVEPLKENLANGHEVIRNQLQLSGVQKTTSAMIEVFKADNTAFKPELFLSVCGLD